MDVAQFSTIGSPERVRRYNRSQSVPPHHKEEIAPSSPKAERKNNNKQNQHPAWWQALKGLGKRRRKSTTSAQAENKSSMEMTWHVNQAENLSVENKTTGHYISCLAFDETGELLGAGCKNGKIVVYSQSTQSHNDRSDSGTTDRSESFVPYVSFQSHESEFDYLRSVEIDEKINKIRWLKRRNQAHLLLATNERTIKLWKVSERHRELDNEDRLNNVPESRSGSSLCLPKYKRTDGIVAATPRRTYFEAHDYRINSLSVNSDLETFLTADDLRINLWHLDVSHQTFNIVDAKPGPSEELTEVITCAEFHPFNCSWFVYGSTKGTIRLCDMRSQALCDKQAKTFAVKIDEDSRTFFSDIIGCIADLKFSESGRYLLARDYLNLNVWDLQMDSHPIETYPICPNLRSKLSTLYENDDIYDKFDCAWGCSDRFVVSGTYSNYLKIHDRTTGRGVMLDSNLSSSHTNRYPWKGKHSFPSKTNVKNEVRLDSLDFKKKLLHTAWRPNEIQLANAVGNSLLFLEGRNTTPELV